MVIVTSWINSTADVVHFSDVTKNPTFHRKLFLWLLNSMMM